MGNIILKGKQILIADDNPINIQLLGQVLSENGYKVIIANSGIQALKVVEKMNPDLVLLDIMMPEMDGFEVCERIKKSPQSAEIPVIFLTARIEYEDILKGFELGAVDYITKPFNSGELLTRVKTHLELRGKTEALKESNRSVRELVHILTHDLSNPINSIHSILDMSRIDPEIITRSKHHIDVAINNCIDIIENVRKMSVIDDGRFILKLEKLNLKCLFEESLLIFERKLLEKNIIIELIIPENLDVYAEKASVINSVFNNILSNAIKYSFQGSVIAISAEQHNYQVKIKIADQGIGMSDILLKELCSLNQGKPASRKGTKGETGTGYGMPLVRKFMEMYNGKMEIISFDGEGGGARGTTVSLFFPTIKE